MFITPCTYCGDIATTVDHVVPRVYIGRFEPSERRRLRLQTVPACHECNSVLGAQVFRSLTERGEYVRAWIAKRYAPALRMPDWSDAELAGMSADFQREIRARLQYRENVKRRVEWRGSDDPELNDLWSADLARLFAVR